METFEHCGRTYASIDRSTISKQFGHSNGQFLLFFEHGIHQLSGTVSRMHTINRKHFIMKSE